MLHEPAAPVGDDRAAAYKTRLGVWMFAFYFLIYAGFVAVNLAKPLWMEKPVLLGMNLAAVYGMALIIVALGQAVVYDVMCRMRERRLEDPTEARGAH